MPSPRETVAQRLIAHLCQQAENPSPAARAVVVIAHPDDETVGAGSRLPRLNGANFVCVTDGAPRDLGDASAAGYDTREAYAKARREEFEAALALAGIETAGRIHYLNLVDQEASLRMADLARALSELFVEIGVETVLTQAYEGGHPDHDAVAFAVHQACTLIEVEGLPAPAIVEMTSYHEQDGDFVFGEFIPKPERAEAVVELTEAEFIFKECLVNCYVTQQHLLERIPMEFERFRFAPDYDFTQPPQPGPPLYERFPWGMTGDHWRELARAALAELGADTTHDADPSLSVSSES